MPGGRGGGGGGDGFGRGVCVQRRCSPVQASAAARRCSAPRTLGTPVVRQRFSCQPLRLCHVPAEKRASREACQQRSVPAEKHASREACQQRSGEKRRETVLADVVNTCVTMPPESPVSDLRSPVTKPRWLGKFLIPCQAVCGYGSSTATRRDSAGIRRAL